MTGTLRRVLVRAPRPEDAVAWRAYGWHAEPEPTRMLEEHEAFRVQLEDAGAEVILAETPVPMCPDSIYVYDPALVTDAGALLLRPGKEGRRAEVEAIAAANALNDVFAMGGKPLVALSIAAFPEELPLEAVRAVFDGAAEKVREAGAVLAGGHTIRDAEPKYGLAVVGTVHPDGIWPKNGARVGDALFLTKPLGTGLVLTGVRKGALGDEELQAAAEAMTTLNAEAADALRAFEPNAVTDVTGFGLFGHAHEMAVQSGVRVVLASERLPALPGAMAMAARGLTTGGDPRNREFLGDALEVNGVPDAALTLGFDPQTGGGLLVSLPAEKAVTLEAHFRAQGLLLARIGRVEAGRGVKVT